MTPFKEEGQHSILEPLYNRKHKRRKSIVENSFGILNKTFKEMQKFDLHVTSLFVVCTCCCLLHNLFRFEDETNIAKLFCIIELEVNAQDKQQQK
jgi:hypothetical protein